MKYNLMVRSWAKRGETIAQKHDALFEFLGTVPEPWGIKGKTPPPAPDPGPHLGCGCNISKLLGKGIRGEVYYDYRRCFERLEPDLDFYSQYYYDDFWTLSFNPKKVDFVPLVYEVVPALMVVFDAYIAQLEDDKFIDVDFDAIGEAPWQGDRRLLVYRISQVCYLDAALCRLNFSLSPEEVVDRLQDSVERVSLVHNGVYIIGSSAPLSLEAADALSRETKQRLLS